VLQDLRFALRLFARDRRFAAAATLALALGIGMNATVFTLVNAVLIRSLPFADADRIIYAGERDTVSARILGVSWLDLQDWRRAQKSFIGMAAWSLGTTMNIRDGTRPAGLYAGAYLSANGFEQLGERPIRGRNFLPDDDRPGASPVVLLGYDLWKSRYGLDPAIVGGMIRVNEVPATVVGIMREGMRFPEADLWMPLAAMPGLEAQPRTQRVGLQAFGRLAAGVSREQALSELSAIAARLEHELPATNANIGARVMTLQERVTGGPVQLVLLAAMGAVGFVLLVACANVANLLLARSARRAREIAVRAAIGATRGRIIRQLLVESLLLAAVAGALGWFLAIAGTRWFDAMTLDQGRPSFLQFTVDWRVYTFFAAVCLATGVIFGLAPALHLSKADINTVMKESGRGGGRRARRWTSALVVAELTLTLVLLSGAGFMVHSFLTLYRLDLGVETAHLLTMSLSLPAGKYPTPAARAAFAERLEERLGAVSTIRGGTLASHVPLGGGLLMRVTIDGRTGPAADHPEPVTRVAVGPRYFATLGLTLARGRAFTPADGAPGQDLAIVNQRVASMYFAGEDPVGRRIRLLNDPPSGPPPAWATIVGVSPTIRQRNIREPDPDAVVYVPIRAADVPAMSLLIRTEAEPSALTGALREEVRALDPDLPLFGVATMDARLAQARWAYRVFGTMFATFAVIALVLSAVGLYAITAYSVAQRAHEIGVRMALGAEPRQVWWMFVRRSAVQVAIGLTLGMAGAVAVGRLLRTLLLQSSPNDPVTLASIAALFAIVTLAACYWPARRATRVNPIAALRCE
jgi:predicted permease